MTKALRSTLLVAAMISTAAAWPDNHLPRAAERVLRTPDRLELWSLEPEFIGMGATGAFQGWKGLGRISISTAEQRAKVVALLRRGIAESDGSVAACFDPRHGIRATSEDTVVDLVICFACLQIDVYVNNERLGHGVLTRGSPQEEFDRLLRYAGVPLASSRP